VIHRRGVTTPGPILEVSLRDQLGVDYADALAALPTTPSRTGRPSALRTAAMRRSYVRTKGEINGIVCYGPHGRANLADIWRHRDLPRDGKAPVLVQVPGGAWVIGWRRPQAYPLLSHLAARGWVCVCR
jgi:acetyl esterase/lipase